MTASDLEGVRIVVTRAQHQASQLVEQLRRVGAVPIELPVIEIAPPGDDGVALRSALERVSSYDWVVLTSINAARQVAPFISQADVSVAAIGPGTAAVLQDEGIDVALIPESYVAESLSQAFPVGPGRVLLPRAAVAREVLITELTDKGWDVDVVEAYRTTLPTVDPALLESTLSADVITFTASSTVNNYVAIAGVDKIPSFVACIGPITAKTASDHGIAVDVVAQSHTIDGLVAAIVQSYSSSKR